MKIDEAIENLSDDTMLYIGAHTGWFFIGTKEQYLELEQAISKYLLHTLKETAEKELSAIRATFRNITADLVSCKHCHKDAQKLLSEMGRKYNHYFQLLNQKREFIPIEDREVMEFYPKILEYDSNSYGIVVAGNEESPYTIIEEWEKARAMKRIKEWAK